MKQSFIILLLCCLIAPLCHALDFTGQVIDAKTGLPVAGIWVSVQDSGNTSAAVKKQTTSTGAYLISLPGTPRIGMSYRISVGPACGSMRTTYVAYVGANPIRTDVSVCQGAALYTLQGQIKLNGQNNNGPVIIKLISISSDDSSAKVVDSFQTAGGSGGFFGKQYQKMPDGKLLLQAALEAGHANYGAYLPTYYTTFPSWHTAQPLSNYSFIGDTTDIVMVDTVRPGGPGCVSGFARSGGIPLPNKIIILTSGSNVAAGFTYTDGVGRFSFDNLALGTYKIYGDVVPKLNPALTMTLTGTRPCIQNLLFEETATLFSARLEVLGVGSGNGTLLDELVPAPNPVLQSLSIAGAERIAGAKQLSVRDISGRMIAVTDVAAGQPLQLNTAGWPAGMYFLQLQTSIGTKSYRVSKQ